MKVKIFKTISLLLISFSFFSCASGPGFDEYSQQIPKLNPEQGRVFVYRISTLGAAVRPKVMIDGQEVGVARADGFFYVDILPGEHELKVSTKKSNTVSFDIEKGQTKYIRIGVRMGLFVGHVDSLLVDYHEALEEISTTNYKGLKSQE